jgi:hypothetical protein
MPRKPACAVLLCPNPATLCAYHAPKSCSREHTDDNGPREENERLREALEFYAKDDFHLGPWVEPARAALAGEELPEYARRRGGGA